MENRERLGSTVRLVAKVPYKSSAVILGKSDYPGVIGLHGQRQGVGDLRNKAKEDKAEDCERLGTSLQKKEAMCGFRDTEQCKACRGQWLDQQRDGLFRFIRRRISNSSDAEDLLQETYLKIYQFFIEKSICIKLDQYCPAFAFRKAGHVLIDFFRKRKVRCHDAHVIWDGANEKEWSSSGMNTSPGPEESCQMRAALVHVSAKMDSQRGRTQRIFTLRFIEEYSFKEIAKIEGVSISCVEKHVCKARRVLRETAAPHLN